MDGMNWFPPDEADAVVQKTLDRNAFRAAMRATAISVVLALAFVFALSVLGLAPTAQDFPSAAAGSLAAGEA